MTEGHAAGRAQHAEQPELVIITGMSGSGKSTALRFFEDLGYYCIDNIPPGLLETLVELYVQSVDEPAPIAAVCDVRSGELFGDLSEAVNTLRDKGYPLTLIFLEASDETLLNRFREKRRTHPMAVGEVSNRQALQQESERLSDIRELADLVLDTTDTDPSELRDRLVRRVTGQDRLSVTQVTLKSFGFKHGMPSDCDFVFDARFLPNPFYEEELKERRGTDESVVEWIFENDEAHEFVDKIAGMIDFTIPHFQRVRKISLTVGVGCTGGHHRSVAIIERLRDRLENNGRSVLVVHRDIDK